MAVTSPPYWSLRDYGIEGQLGLEATPEEYVANMVAVFREVWRVLRDDGTVWLNLGDSYASQPTGSRPGETINRRNDLCEGNGRGNKIVSGLKPKDLVGIPWRVAFALQADGWYLRSDIIWAKPNPMPESVTDRPTKAHEYVFLLSKQARYFYDADAVREAIAESTATDYRINQDYEPQRPVRGFIGNPSQGATLLKPNPAGRNRRTVWNIATQPYSGSHFATFPEALVEPCVKAGTSERGVCPVCGAPWVRVVERTNESTWQKRKEVGGATGGAMIEGGKQQTGKVRSGDLSDLPSRELLTTGWRSTCSHDAADPIPATVLDPFAGSGTVGVVCQRYGRRFVGLDLSMPYLYLAKERIAKANGYHIGRLI